MGLQCAAISDKGSPKLIVLRVYGVTLVQPDYLEECLATAPTEEAKELLREVKIAKYVVQDQSLPPR
jgi:hypothetical protein